MYHLRVNGRGNAWPIQIGKHHAMYQEDEINDYANASFSICKSKNTSYNKHELDWEVLIDAGHGTIPFILNHHNRLPEAIILTHAHFDHTLGADWIVQSYFRQNKKAYPIYASKACMNAFNTVFHHLEGLVEWIILEVGIKTPIIQSPGLYVTAFPVFHGYSAKGASMLLFSQENSDKQVLISGDILCPLIKQEDYSKLNNIDLLIADCNNRFPYPKTNHWSFIAKENELALLSKFYNKFEFVNILKPHFDSDIEKCYVLDLISEINDTKELYWSLSDFIKKVNPTTTALVHYSGSEDEKYYNEKIMTTEELEYWANSKIQESNTSSQFIVPKTGDVYSIFQ